MYVPLYVKTNYSLLSSLIKIDDLISYALKNHITSIAISDENLYGMMEFYHKCKDNNIKAIIGLEISLEDSSVLLYAKNYNGYQTLTKLSTIQSSRKVEINDIEKYHNDIITIIPFTSNSLYPLLKKIFTDLYIGYSNKQEENASLKITDHVVFIRKSLYILEKDKEYLKYLYMIRDGKTVSDNTNYNIDDFSLNISNIYEYSSNKNLFTTNKISDLCNFEFPKRELLIPKYKETNGLSSHEYLTNLSKAGLQKRLNNQVPFSYLERLNYELEIIEKMGFSNYFLVVYDYIRYAKKNKILVGPGRGSGAGSLVCYAIGITDIDPIEYDLIFERFLNPERVTMPDIDTDFPDIYRNQVIEYVIEKYGSKRVSGIIAFGTLATKQVIRDISRVLNIPTYQIDLITKRIPTVTKKKLKDFYQEDYELRQMIENDTKLTKMYKIASYLEGYPRHTTIHAAGIVMCQKDLDEVLPLTFFDDMYLTSFTMEYLEELGLLKMDFLGIKNLTIIMNILSLIEEKEGKKIDFNKIPLNDEKVLEIFASAKTAGIFQFESDGMKNFLRKLKPNTLEDIFAAIALFRPGPSQNIDSYIRRKHQEEEITYLSSSLEPILKSTYGIIVYQEQIMQIANVLAGYTLGEADILRRAMSKMKMDVLKGEEEKFINGSIKRGYPKEVAKEVFDLILNFANFGFNRSHSVAYSIIAYKMAYLKYYYPKYFYSCILSSTIGSDSKTKEYIKEVKSLGIEVLKPCINHSSCNYEIENEKIYYPLSGIRNIGIISCNEIIANRKDGYIDIFDFISRVSGMNRKVLESLIKAGCFDIFGISRKTYIENLDAILNYTELVTTLEPEFVLKPELEIKEEYTKEELVTMEKELFGLYLSNHPVTSYKAKIEKAISFEDMNTYFNKTVVCVALVEKVKIIKTKNGDEMMFFDGSDEYAKIDFILFPKTYQKFSEIKIGDILKINGCVEKRYDVYQVIVDEVEKLN